jgi:DNA-binding transcriptional ArsR family regulator
MSVKNTSNGLRFACDCVSGFRGQCSEPWAPVAKNRLLPDGTKEDILNVLAKRPKTISQIADALGLSAPTVFTHVRDMLNSELIRGAAVRRKAHPSEHYYEPNFPVIDQDEAAALCRLCDDLSLKFAALFKKNRRQLESAFRETPLAGHGWSAAEVAQYVYASVQRGAREILEQDGTLAPPKTHRNGVGWVFWAEKPTSDDDV